MAAARGGFVVLFYAGIIVGSSGALWQPGMLQYLGFGQWLLVQLRYGGDARCKQQVCWQWWCLVVFELVVTRAAAVPRVLVS